MRVGRTLYVAAVLLWSLAGGATPDAVAQAVAVTKSSAPLAQSVASNEVNGACGSANGGGFTSAPRSRLCGSGAASTVSGSGPWSWSCAGSDGGTTAICAASLAANGACGSANAAAATSAPSANLCNSGTASAVTGSGPWTWTCAGSGGGTTASCEAPTTAVQKPGPSVQLFANPYYTCVTNYYVATTGSDANNGTSPAAPWLTLQHANNALSAAGKAAGSCINVAPGSYANGVSVTAGGNLAAATGYLVYRCTTLDACTITDPGKVFCAGLNCSGVYPNYLIVDGFTFAASSSSPYAFAFGCYNGNSGTTASGCHHWWFINNIVSGYAQGGVGLNDSEFFYTSHNTIYNNAQQCNGIYGSGLAYVSLKVVQGYSETADDTNANNNPALNALGLQGPAFPFHNLAAWNVVYNNYNTCTNGSDSDGNGIIMDSFGTQNGNPVSYTEPTLVAFNVVYNNGGGGVHIFASEEVTAANNTCYHNGLDPYGANVSQACIDTNQSYSNTIINNIAVAIPAAPASGGCAAGVPPYQDFANAILGGPASGMSADTFSNNITQLQGGHNSCWGILGWADPPTGENPMFNADIGQYSCASNKCATNPLWVNAGATSLGSETTPPVGANFTLQSGSPAIGYGLAEPYLPPQSTDAGACYHTLASCP
jgi:parallel beta-helix repeat protein